MPHTIEPASSGRAKCRGCGRNIAKEELRFGERLPNPFAEGTEMTHWFHLPCAAMKRPDVFLDTTSESEFAKVVPDVEDLRRTAEDGITHRRLPRVDGAERSPSGRAVCRNCKELIEKDVWRIKLVFYEEGMFNPAGYIHLACSGEYFETTEILDRVRNFSSELTDEELGEVRVAIQNPRLRP